MKVAGVKCEVWVLWNGLVTLDWTDSVSVCKYQLAGEWEESQWPARPCCCSVSKLTRRRKQRDVTCQSGGHHHTGDTPGETWGTHSHSVTTHDRTDTIQDTQTHHSQDHMPASSPLSPVQPPTLPPTTQSQLTVPTLPLYRLQIFTDPSSNLSAVLHLRGLFLSHLQSISALFLCEILTVQWEL